MNVCVCVMVLVRWVLVICLLSLLLLCSLDLCRQLLGWVEDPSGLLATGSTTGALAILFQGTGFTEVVLASCVCVCVKVCV